MKLKHNMYTPKNIVSDVNYVANTTDTNLVNPWGLVIDHDNIWVADNGTDKLTHYKMSGQSLPEIINVVGMAPTGLIRNRYQTGFVITSGQSQPADLIVVTENGTIDGYNAIVDPINTITAASAVNGVFKGVTQLNNKLYVCNFYSGFVEIYDSTFTKISQFTDTSLTDIGYAPFNAKQIDGYIYVTFAKQDDVKHDDVNGLGHGFIDVFNPTGNFIRRFVNRGALNSPWGLHEMKMKVDEHATDVLLVGNFGDGVINIYHLKNGDHLGSIVNQSGVELSFDGLWGIAKDDHNLVITSGFESESHGLLTILKD